MDPRWSCQLPVRKFLIGISSLLCPSSQSMGLCCAWSWMDRRNACVLLWQPRLDTARSDGPGVPSRTLHASYSGETFMVRAPARRLAKRRLQILSAFLLSTFAIMPSWVITEKVSQRELLDAQWLRRHTSAAHMRCDIDAKGLRWKLRNVLFEIGWLNQVSIWRRNTSKAVYSRCRFLISFFILPKNNI